VSHLNGWYTGSRQVHQRFTPEQLEVERVGHHGFFRAEFAPLWDELVVPWVAGAEC
jgi:hypothetical protein